MPTGFAVLNGQVWTGKTHDSRAEALLIERGTVVAAGEERTMAAKAVRRGLKTLDAGGRWILPGLIDSHTHLIHQGLLRQRLDLWKTTSLPEALGAVRRRLTTHPRSQVLIAERWDEGRWKERRFPRRDELDALSRTVPIILRRVDGHTAVANEAACRLVAPQLPGVDVDSGMLVEEASLNLNQVFPTPLPDCVQALQWAQEEALAFGVTTVHDFVVPSYVRAYRELHRRRQLRIRAHVSLYVEYLDALERIGLTSGWGDERLRFHGVKIFADGSFGGRTAALDQPYADQPENRGRLNYDDASLATLLATAQRAGLPASSHAIGDAAIAQVASGLDALPRAKRLRHRIEHFELSTPDADRILARRGIVASMQPNFVGAWSGKGGMYHARVGSRRFRRTNEFRRLLQEGVTIAFGSDCMPFDPWYGIQACLDAPYPAQRLDLARAVHAYTAGSAWGLGRERDLGHLGAGAQADFCMVDAVPARGKPVASSRVVATFIGGEPLFTRRPGLVRFR